MGKGIDAAREHLEKARDELRWANMDDIDISTRNMHATIATAHATVGRLILELAKYGDVE